MVDPQLAVELTRVVQDALEAEATRRSTNALPGLADRAQREAFAVAVLRREFLKLDERRLSDGAARLTVADESELTERVLAEAVGLGPADLLLADETVEEVAATRHDLVFVMRSDASRELLDDVLWRSEKVL